MACAVENALAAYSATTATPHEYFDHTGTLPRRVRLRQCKFLNNVVEQDLRTVKKRTWLAKGYGSFVSAWRTLQGIEAWNMIRKERVRWVAKGDSIGQAAFVAELLGLAA